MRLSARRAFAADRPWDAITFVAEATGRPGFVVPGLIGILLLGDPVRDGWVWVFIIGLVVLFAYGSVLLGAMPVLHQCGGVSWQGHLCGALAGVVAAYLLSAPERKARAAGKTGTRRAKT